MPNVWKYGNLNLLVPSGPVQGFICPIYIYIYIYIYEAWGGVVLLRYWSEGPGIDPLSLGIFSGASDSSMCPGVDSASKNEYQDFPGG